jgi:hypothetical protein
MSIKGSEISNITKKPFGKYACVIAMHLPAFVEMHAVRICELIQWKYTNAFPLHGLRVFHYLSVPLGLK